MQIQTLADRLETALLDALELAPGAPLDVLADRFIDSEPELIRELTPKWQHQAVVDLLRRKRAELRRAEQDRQLVFPEFEKQFIHIPGMIRVDENRRIPRSEMTYTDARKYVAALRRRQQDTPRFSEARQMLLLLYRYSRRDKGITWAQVVELEGGTKKTKKAK